MATTRSVKIKLVYNDATSRTYTFNGVASTELIEVKDRVLAINASLGDWFKDIDFHWFMDKNKKSPQDFII